MRHATRALATFAALSVLSWISPAHANVARSGFCVAALTQEDMPYSSQYPKDAVLVERQLTPVDRRLWKLTLKAKRRREFGSIELLDAKGNLITFSVFKGRQSTIDGESIDEGLKRALASARKRAGNLKSVAVVRLVHTHPGGIGGYVSIDYDFSPSDSWAASSYRDELDRSPELRRVDFEMQIIFRSDDGLGITKRAFVLKPR